MVKLFENKADCCGCGACESICPKSAITLKKDEYGFVYPEIDSQLCVECKLCKSVCGFQNSEKENTPIETYAAAVNDEEAIMRSTSGGIFAVLAREMLKRDGAVFGAGLEKTDNAFTVHHICVESSNDLDKILKSKYVHSATEDCYIKAKELLDSGRNVLYSGTPCQIAGLKGYLRKPYENLITVDLVCHGVPSLELFRSYIEQIEKRESITITDFQFRDKEKGSDFYNKIIYNDSNNLQKSMTYNEKNINFSFMDIFLNGTIYRENCYSCKYTGANRPADITIGDFWGIQRVHPEWLSENSGRLDRDKGISCVITNTQKGADFFESVKKNLIYYKATFEEAAQGNTQLRHPVALTPERQKILEGFKNNGYAFIESRYLRYLKTEKIKAKIKRLLPEKLKNALKSIIKGKH